MSQAGSILLLEQKLADLERRVEALEGGKPSERATEEVKKADDKPKAAK